MKVLFVSQENIIGGATKSMVELILGLNEAGVETDVLIPKATEKNRKAYYYIKNNGIKCFEIFYRHNYKLIGIKKTIDYENNIINAMALSSVVTLVKRNKYDAICSNSVSVDIGAKVAKTLNLPHIFYIREFMEEDFGIEFRNKKNMRMLIEQSQHIVFISDSIKQKYTDCYNISNFSQFYDGFDTRKYLSPSHEILDGKIIKLVFVGKIQDGKGAKNLLGLYKRLIEEFGHKFHLEYVGDGETSYIAQLHSEAIKLGISESVVFSGFSDNVKEILEKKDILIMNSENEGMGRVTIEAMLCGCLVVGKNKCGTSELIADGVNGLLFDNEKNFVEKFDWIINNKRLAKAIAVNSRDWAEKSFEKKVCTTKFIDILRKL